MLMPAQESIKFDAFICEYKLYQYFLYSLYSHCLTSFSLILKFCIFAYIIRLTAFTSGLFLLSVVSICGMS